ncbi:disulfide-bond oxidoreductase YfcG [Variibacter gotjawalensis]|uniref:Disulfide-bond oxidoreductase YfcG n=1 Tax=Variibacter gotjawalensis TaxID=1333996 RepID=A0A0S3PYZ7_9BRAD|nr:glutathione S-transferase [Variibacter gotjawalensis]NIK46955.1 glutathione S-transferase [Variibacter gotjawalensis]RZS48859.1 glutathione S-transferase [Variibacter gotjawalensis]BAT61118.1 disulfide-bond oxidoreductase YfcG [Variibacter gotjawalensis]
MASTKLYCFAQSGNAYKAALMLALTKSDWEPVFVDFFNGETRGDAYRATVNEMGEVPVLVEADEKLSQTGVILPYLAEQTGKFWPADAKARREVMRWIMFDNHKFTSYLATYRFLHAFAKSDPPVVAFLLARVKAAIAIVEKHLGTQPFIAGNEPTIADISMCGYLFYPKEEFGFDIAAENPNIAAWLDRIRALPGWVHPYELMPGHPLK